MSRSNALGCNLACVLLVLGLSGTPAIARAEVIGTVPCGQGCNPTAANGTQATNDIAGLLNSYLEDHTQPIGEGGALIQVCGQGPSICQMYGMNYSGVWVTVPNPP